MAVLSNTMMQGTAAISDEAESYQIEKSIRFNNADGPQMKWTPDKEGNTRIWTYSTWLKRGDPASGTSNRQMFFNASDSSENGSIEFWSEGITAFHHSSGSFQWQLTTNGHFRDPTAWYHVVVACDVHQSVAAERLKMYVNGEQITSFATASYPSQYYADNPYNEGGEIQNLGNYAGSSSYKYDGYYADTYMIDGMQLSPTAFGEFDSTGCWNPKAFSLPAPNQDVTWTPSSGGPTNPGQMFNGNLSDYCQLDNSAGIKTITTQEFTVNASLRVKIGSNAGYYYDWIINGSKYRMHTSAGAGWYTIPIPKNLTITSFTGAFGPSSGDYIYAWEVDGVILVDGQTDPDTFNNPNNGTTWSNQFTLNTGSYGSSEDPPGGFTGFTGQAGPGAAYDHVAPGHTSNSKCTWNTYITFEKSFKFTTWCNKDSSNAIQPILKINDVNVATSVVNAGADSYANRKEIEFANHAGISSPITKIEFSSIQNVGASGNGNCGLSLLKVDGVPVIDSITNNSWHLKFNDTTSLQTLGYSQVMNTPTGAQPMYGPGADDSAKASLVWALPGYDTADHSHTIKGSGSAVSHTVNGSVASGTQSKFYGSSLYFDGSNDDIQSPVSTDFQLGTSDFTIEAWLYMPSSGFTAPDGWVQCSAGDDDWSMLPFYRSSDGNLYFYGTKSSGSWDWSAKNYGAIATNKWTHYAVVRNGSTFKGYTNGKEAWTFTDSGTVYQAENQMNIGSCMNGGNAFAIGYLNDFRYYKGTAKYTSNFIVPARNDFIAQNLTLTDGSNPENIDSVVDSPTSYGSDSGAGGQVRGNYCTWNYFSDDGCTISQGNLRAATTSQNKRINSTFPLSNGKWYWEIKTHLTDKACHIGIADMTTAWKTGSGPAGAGHNGHVWVAFQASHSLNGYYTHNGSDVQTNLPQTANGDTFQFAYDADTGKFWMGKNNTWITNASGNVGNPGAGTHEAGTVSADYRTTMIPVVGAGGGTDQIDVSANFGQRAYKYTAPSGFKALCTKNLDDTFSGDELNNPSKYFDILQYTGSGDNDQAVGGLAFTPDFVWIKNRSHQHNYNEVFDQVRGVAKSLFVNTNGTETDYSGGDNSLRSFDTTGFTVNDDSQGAYGVNGAPGSLYSGDSKFVAWCWDAGTAAATASTQGSITVNGSWTNATAGFEVLTHTGTGANGTVGHNLGAKPDLIISKNTTGSADNWFVYHSALGATKYMMFNTNDEVQDSDTVWQDAEPTNTVYSVSTGGHNDSGVTLINYLWTAIPGYSKFGSYEGNGSADGPYIYTGFRPRYIWYTNADTAGRNWFIQDTARSPHNNFNEFLRINDPGAEGNVLDGSGGDLLIMSNGFKWTTSNNDQNNANDTFIYAAFAEHPFKTARAR